MENKDWIPIQKIEYFVYSKMKGDHIIGFVRDVFSTSIETLGSKGIIKFSGLFRICTSQRPLDYFLFITNQPALIGAINSRQKKFINIFTDENIPKSEEKIKIHEFKNKQAELLKGWEDLTEKGTIKFYSNEWYCLEFNLNTYEKTAQLKKVPSLPINPENYPDRGFHFSEMIKFTCAFFNNRLLQISDLEWLTTNEQLTKIWIDIMDDKSIDLSKIFINQNNLNEWRYSSPKVELEILHKGIDRKNKAIKEKNKLHEKIDSIKEDTSEIKILSQKSYVYLTTRIPNKEELEEIVSQLNEESIDSLISWLELAFIKREVKELENFTELESIFENAKKSSNWETKLKLVVPLINLIGIKIETEVKYNFKKHINQIVENAEDFVVRNKLFL